MLQWPLNSEGAAVQCYVLMKRRGGLLIALPSDFLTLDVLQEAQQDVTSALGPFTTLTVPAAQEIGGGEEIQAGFDMDVLVVDVQSDVLPFLTLLSQSAHQDVHPFFVEDVVYPEVGATLKLAREWVVLQGGGIQNFYSAEEGPPSPKVPAPMKATAKKPPAEKAKRLSGPQEVAEHIKSLAELVPNIAMQLSAIQEEQARMRTEMEVRAAKPPLRSSQMPVSMDMQNLGKVLGAPPRTKQVTLSPPPPKQVAASQPMVDSNVPLEEQVEVAQEVAEAGTLAMAVLEQSRALTSLVSQLQSGDPLLDSHQSSFSTSSKGAQGRERLQTELGARSGNFMLSMMQLAMRRMRPATPTPTSLAQIAESDFSMVSYLERFGGFGSQRELGTILYALSFVVDAAVREDIAGVQEHLALLYVAIEQANMDQGRWDLAFQLLLLDDPPAQLWTYNRAGNPMSTGRSRAFAPLCPQRWATISLAFLKELDFIHNRRTEMGKKMQPAQVEDPPKSPSPRRRPKFPKAKGGGGGDPPSGAASSSQ